MLIIIFLYALCALSFTLCKAGLSYSQPFFFVAVRMLLAGVVLLTYQVSKYGWKLIRKKDWWKYLQIIMFHIYGAYMLELWSMQYVSSIQTACIYNISPLMAALFSYIFFKEVLSSKKWLGLAIGMIGFIPQLHMLSSQGNISHNFVALIGLLGSVACTMYGWALMRHMINEHHYSPLSLNAIAMLGGGLLALITSMLCEDWHPVPVSDTLNFIYITIGLIVSMNIIFYNLYGHLLKTYSNTLLAFCGFMTPFLSSLFGYFFLGESLSASLFISLGIVSVGLYLFYQQEINERNLARTA